MSNNPKWHPTPFMQPRLEIKQCKGVDAVGTLCKGVES